MRTLAKLLGGAAALVAVTALPASAAPRGGSQCALVLNPPTVPAGGTVALSTNGCTAFAPSAAVNVAIEGASLGSATADGSGGLTASVTIPLGAAPGRHTIRATGDGPSGAPAELTAALVVGASDMEALAFTGSPSRPLLWIGFLTLSIGTALLFGSRAGVGFAGPSSRLPPVVAVFTSPRRRPRARIDPVVFGFADHDAGGGERAAEVVATAPTDAEAPARTRFDMLRRLADLTWPDEAPGSRGRPS